MFSQTVRHNFTRIHEFMNIENWVSLSSANILVPFDVVRAVVEFPIFPKRNRYFNRNRRKTQTHTYSNIPKRTNKNIKKTARNEFEIYSNTNTAKFMIWSFDFHSQTITNDDATNRIAREKSDVCFVDGGNKKEIKKERKQWQCWMFKRLIFHVWYFAHSSINKSEEKKTHFHRIKEQRYETQ